MNNILVTRSSMPELDEYIDEIKDIWDTHWLTNMGVKHQKLQQELKEYLKVEEIDLFTNGHMAIELSLQAMNLPKGSEVITTPFTFASTTHAIVRNGLEPVFCDINEEDFTIDVSKIESLITDKTCAIVPVHVYGNICNIEEIEKILKNAEVVVEEEVDLEKISIGCKVKILDCEFDEELEYKIVGSTEANSLKGKISNESPVGRALLGKKVGETITVETEAGELSYKVLEIQRSTVED